VRCVFRDLFWTDGIFLYSFLDRVCTDVGYHDPPPHISRMALSDCGFRRFCWTDDILLDSFFDRVCTDVGYRDLQPRI